MLKLILKENSFQLNGKDYLKIHGTALGTTVAVAFANIFMAKIERKIQRQSVTKPPVSKRYIDDVSSLWNLGKRDTSSNKQTHITLQLYSQQKSQTPKLHFWIQ